MNSTNISSPDPEKNISSDEKVDSVSFPETKNGDIQKAIETNATQITQITLLPESHLNTPVALKILAEIIKNILQNPENRPQKVIIILDKITDHMTLPNVTKKDFKKEIDYRKNLAKFIKDALIAGGIAENSIEIILYDVSPAIIRDLPADTRLQITSDLIRKFIKADEKGIWLLADRNVGLKNNEVLQHTKIFPLPIADFLQAVNAEGLLSTTG